MTNSDISNINHVGMAVRDLHDTASRYERMGFQLTPYSPHSAAWKPGESVKPQGSGNRCVMFSNNYLEILASEDPKQPAARIMSFLKRHQGACIICFDTETPQVVDKRLQSAGIGTSGVIPLQREIDTPEGERTAKFERVQFAPDHSPEGYIQAARHLTPQYIYQPRYIAHPNGCTQLSQAIVVTDAVEEFTKKYETYTGLRADRQGRFSQFSFDLGAKLTIIETKHAAEILPGTLLPPLPAIAGVAFRCPNLADQRKRLTENGIYFAETQGRLVVPAEEASGVVVLFEE
jgi:hypothetical protein